MNATYGTDLPAPTGLENEKYSGAPYSDTPHSGTPHSDTPYSGAPKVFRCAQARRGAYSGAPYSDTPYSDTPYSDAPKVFRCTQARRGAYSGAPYSDTPYSGAPYSGAPKGQSIKAQGNALGIKSFNIPSPERAAQSTLIGTWPALSGLDFIPIPKPRALPWASIKRPFGAGIKRPFGASAAHERYLTYKNQT